MRLMQSLWRICLLFAVASFSGGMGIVTVILYQVYFGDDSYLKKTSILAKISEETQIFYTDDVTPIGSFFDNSHRRYIPFSEIPAHMVHALVASEDKNFYHHSGVDVIAIMHAFFEGIKEGSFKRGGSSITQQTVKNLLDKRERTFKRKFREVIAALQLERLYNKDQILEFYFNQFHVAGNGNGVGIAAKYYFNKEVNELNLIEAAFIAGSVKGPSAYNPFIKYTKEAQDKAKELAFNRKNYVLRRMYEQGYITKELAKEHWNEQIPFNRGKFRSTEVSL